MSTLEKKPCPFCNSSDLDIANFGPGAAVECLNCEAQGPKVIIDSEEQDDKHNIEAEEETAVEMWNERVAK